jgi:hypothetical protein
MVRHIKDFLMAQLAQLFMQLAEGSALVYLNGSSDYIELYGDFATIQLFNIRILLMFIFKQQW